MNTSTPHAPPPSTASDRPTWADLLQERVLLVSVPAFFGPPIIFVLGPWLLLALLLIGPFALILTGLLVLTVLAGLLVAVVAVIASPYLVLRHLHTRGMGRANPRAPLHLFRTRRVSSRPLGSLQPKGMS